VDTSFEVRKFNFLAKVRERVREREGEREREREREKKFYL
jgi:hypothetical protein